MSFLNRMVEGIFFNGDARSYWRPEHYGLKGEPFETTNASGDRISGMYLQQTVERRRGVVLFCHAAQFNMEFNLPQVVFLAMRGFGVLLFDYAGCGLSSGSSSIDGMLEDAEAAVAWLDASPWKVEKLLLFGEGVGGDAALQYRTAHPERVLGMLLESVYANRKGWLLERFGPGVGTAAAKFLSVRTEEPAAMLSRVDVPVMLLRPGKDDHLRSGQWNALCEAAPKGTESYVVSGRPYLGIFADRQGPWHDAAEKFFKRCVQGERKK